MFRVEPVPGKPSAFRVFRDCDNGKAWHPDDMLDRYSANKKGKDNA